MQSYHKKTVTIRNRNGKILYGIVSLPVAEKCKRKLLIFSQVGIVTKTGMGDHLRVLADNLALQGFSVLRFDQSGTGDSFGEVTSDISIFEFFRQVQDGFFKNDLIDVINWALKEFNDYSLFLFGECGGCISTILACVEKSSMIAGIIMLASPVLLYPLGTEIEIKEIRGFDAQVTFKSYLQKIFNPVSYFRLLAGRSDLKLIRQSFTSVFAKNYNSLLSLVRFRFNSGCPDHERFNYKFWDAFQKLAKNSTPIFFLMPEFDNETFEFDTEFKEKVLNNTKKFSEFCTISYLPETDHSIMFQRSRSYLLQQLLNWLERA